MSRETLSGIRLRPYAGESDLAAIARLENLESEADDIPERTSVGSIAARFANPSEHFDPRRDVTLAEIDGLAVGLAMREWVDTTDGAREYRSHGCVDPAWRRRGLGTILLAENERRLRALVAGIDPSVETVFGSWSGETQLGDVALLDAAGYERVRWFFEMTRPNLSDVPDIAVPEGLTVREVTPELAARVWAADIEAFQDHWGGFDRSDASLQRWLDDPSTDLSLWIVAFDGDEVAGGVVNVIDAAENAALDRRRGLLASVFTRRPWRRRGLARALIARSLLRLRAAGMSSAVLGVDAENPSGALELYEGIGFEVEYRSTAWRKPLEPLVQPDQSAHDGQ